MIYLRGEGEPFKGNGFHFYPLSDPSSIGVHFKWNETVLWFRYSKVINKFHLKRYYYA